MGSLVLRFAVASLAIFLAAGFAVSRAVSSSVLSRELAIARFRGQSVSESVLRVRLSQQDLAFLTPFTGSRYDLMLRFLHQHVLHYPVLHVRLWRSDGEIVLADTERLVGRTRPLTPGAIQTFRTGQPTTDVGRPNSLDGGGIVPLDTYVPVFLQPTDSIPVAIAQVVQDYGAVKRDQGRTLRKMLLPVGLGFAAIYMLLLPTVGRLGRKLSRKNGELAGALNREQEGALERKRLLDKVLTVSEEERRGLAAELHDGPVQQLSSVSIGLRRLHLRVGRGDMEGAERILGEIGEDVSRQIGNLRSMMVSLRPPALESLGLEAALRDKVEQLGREGGVDCRLECSVHAALGPDVETVLYRVSQEALTNVVRHAQARHAVVRLHTENGRVVLEVADDGKGFVQRGEAATSTGDHFGLLAMRERVLGIGGTWQLTSRPGRGTRIVATVPRIPGGIES